MIPARAGGGEAGGYTPAMLPALRNHFAEYVGPLWVLTKATGRA